MTRVNTSRFIVTRRTMSVTHIGLLPLHSTQGNGYTDTRAIHMPQYMFYARLKHSPGSRSLQWRWLPVLPVLWQEPATPAPELCIFIPNYLSAMLRISIKQTRNMPQTTGSEGGNDEPYHDWAPCQYTLRSKVCVPCQYRDPAPVDLQARERNIENISGRRFSQAFSPPHRA